ncbi:MAG: hypothetical protein NVS2B4_05710 [Ramlibacter sp.]
MTTHTLRESQQSMSRPSGTWRLEAGRAMTLHPVQAGELRVARGRLWATLDGPHCGPALGLGDLVVEPGNRLHLRAGQRLVIESANSREAVDFAWALAAAPHWVPAQRWQPVLQSWQDLRSALAQAGDAACGLAAGLVAVGLTLLRRRLSPLRLPA